MIKPERHRRLGHRFDQVKQIRWSRSSNRGKRIHHRFIDPHHIPHRRHQPLGKLNIRIRRRSAPRDRRHPQSNLRRRIGHHPHHPAPAPHRIKNPVRPGPRKDRNHRRFQPRLRNPRLQSFSRDPQCLWLHRKHNPAPIAANTHKPIHRVIHRSEPQLIQSTPIRIAIQHPHPRRIKHPRCMRTRENCMGHVAPADE